MFQASALRSAIFFLHAPLVIAKLINHDADELAVYPLRNEQHIDLVISTTLVW
jgi:hypothetical protein